MSDIRKCDECGRSGLPGFHLASASRVANGTSETRYFCHNDERSCYNDQRGRYFEVPVPDAEITYCGVNLDDTLTTGPIDIHEGES